METVVGYAKESKKITDEVIAGVKALKDAESLANSNNIEMATCFL